MRNVLAAAAAFLALAAPASAISSFGSLTGDAFYGDGNPNADFTIERQRALEIALKAKTRFGLGAPADASLGLYVFDRAGRTLDSLAFWNFDWSVNVDRNDATPNDLTTFTYLFSLDRDPSPGTDFVQFDFITAPQVPPFPVGSFWDHSFGDNTTDEDTDDVATNRNEYVSLLGSSTTVQQSWNYGFGFLNNPAPAGFGLGVDPNGLGIYTIELQAFAGSTPRAKASIDVVIIDSSQEPEVPLPAAAPLLLTGLAGMAWTARRRRG